MPVLSSVLTFARTQAQTDSNGLNDANGVVFGNEALLDFRRRLINAGVDAGQINEFSQTGTVNTGIYSYPTNPSVMWLKTIELNYANTTAADYKVATQLDVSNLPAGKSVGWVRTNANSQAPYFDDRGDEYEIFPTPTSAHNVTSLISLFYYQTPIKYVSSASSLVYPESLDDTIIGWRIAADYKYSLGGENIKEGDAFNLKYEERVKQLIATLSRGSQQPIQATPLQIDGWEF